MKRPRKDPTAGRHKGAAESREAFLSTPEDEHKAMRELIYRMALRRRKTGITTDEVSVLTDRAPNRISGRLTELKKEGRLVMTGRRRMTRLNKTAHVLVAAQYAEHARA